VPIGLSRRSIKRLRVSHRGRCRFAHQSGNKFATGSDESTRLIEHRAIQTSHLLHDFYEGRMSPRNALTY